MNNPNPIKQPLLPAPTLGAGTGATVAALIIWALSLKGITFPPALTASLSGLVASIGAHLPKVFQLRR